MKGVLIFLALSTVGQAQNKLPEGVFSKQPDCESACVGLRDAGCPPKGIVSTGNAFCQCQPGYYNNKDHCENECEYQQFWSLFTYGKCAEYATPPGAAPVGMCNKVCAFRVRVWATVFIIILFTSAVTLLILMIPGFVTSCYTCCFLKKQHRRNEEDAAIAQVTDPHGQIVKPGAAAHHQQQQMSMHQGGWQYPFYGWPSSYYGQGR